MGTPCLDHLLREVKKRERRVDKEREDKKR